MIVGLPFWITVLFCITCLATISLFYYANGKPRRLTLGILIWSALHSILAYSGFYENTSDVPPRFALVLVPATLLIVYGLLPNQQAWFLDKRNLLLSTLLHSIRLPIEIALFGLFINEMVPEIMTFDGLNFDILMGITAPVVGLCFYFKKIGEKWLLIWNVVGLILIFSIFTIGILSAELPFQQFGIEQPNRAVIYFPFILLPATIVPIVIWTHLSDIILLWKKCYDSY